jgi:hypothetical protein
LNRAFILKCILLIEITFLLCNAVLVSRDYQDTWILEGLEIPTTFLLVTFAIYTFVEKELSWLLIFGLIFRAALGIVPSLKYPYFQGVAIDQHMHYFLSHDIYQTGQIRSGARPYYLYSGNPLMHISFANFSMLTGLDLLTSFKIYSGIPWLLFPVITYLVLKRLAPNNTTIHRYAIIMSSIPLSSSSAFIVVGLTFGPLILYILLYLLLRNYQSRSRYDTLLFLFFNIFLAGTHSFTAISLSLLLTGAFLIWQIFSRRRMYPRLYTLSLSIATVIVTNVAWFFFISTTRNVSIEGLFTFVLRTFGIIESPFEGIIAPRFFDIESLFESMRIIVVFLGADIILWMAAVTGCLICYKLMTRKDVGFLLYMFYLVAAIGFMGTGFALNIGWQ